MTTAWQQPSPRMLELIRAGAWQALNPSREWLEEFDRITLAACPPVAQDPALAALVMRSNRANLVHFASSMLHNPGKPVAPNLSDETLRMARDLVRRGLDAVVREIYRIAHNVAWQRWTEIAFELTSDPEELRELLDAQFQAANEYVDRTVAGVFARTQLEYAAMAQDRTTGRRKLVELILNGVPVSRERAESRLGYAFAGTHTAAVIWGDASDDRTGRLDRAAEAFGRAVGCQDPLIVAAGGIARWMWVRDVAAPDAERIRIALSATPGVRVAIGSTAPGVEGFRRSHHDAVTTCRMVDRLRSRQPVALFDDVQMVALLTENADGADEFVKSTLGDFASASPTLHATVLTYVNAECNASRAAKVLYTHRNTLLRRLESARRLLPRPLAQNTVEVAVAIRTLQWRGNQRQNSARGGHSGRTGP